MSEMSITVPCITPKRVPLSDLLREGDDARAAAAQLAAPAAPCPVCPFLDRHWQEYRDAVRLAALLGQAHLREKELLGRIADLEAKLLLREGQLFGTKADVTPPPDDSPTST